MSVNASNLVVIVNEDLVLVNDVLEFTHNFVLNVGYLKGLRLLYLYLFTSASVLRTRYFVTGDVEQKPIVKEGIDLYSDLCTEVKYYFAIINITKLK